MLKLAGVILFAIAFAFVESSVVVYLRALYYPEGFQFPLKLLGNHHLAVELAREGATLVMLAAVGMIAGVTRWERFAYFLIAFGVWDIFYYIWLKVAIGWPASILDWDILFLIPVPWIGPVIAPVLVSVLMIVAGFLILHRDHHHGAFRVPLKVWIIALAGTALILLSFTIDTAATLRQHPPEPYHYELFAAGIALYLVAMVMAFRQRRA
ncbi:MAG: hypothetical protein WD182_05090 [Bacteroidota bacterium]